MRTDHTPHQYLLQNLTDGFVLVQLLPSQDLLEFLIHLSEAARDIQGHRQGDSLTTLEVNSLGPTQVRAGLKLKPSELPVVKDQHY